MVSKRGMLAIDEVIKLILGIAVFIFIIFLIFQFGKMVSNTLREEQAQNTLSDVVFQIQNLESGQEKNIVVEGPKNWFLYAHNESLCLFPLTCLQVLKNTDLLSEAEIKAGKDNVIPICRSSGFCNTSMNVTIPFDSIDYKTGYVVSYIAQFVFGSSTLVQADVRSALLIGEKIVPQTIKLRKIDNQTTIINVPSTKELVYIDSLVSTANKLSADASETLNFSGVAGEYLHYGSIIGDKSIKVVCLCNSKKIIDCGRQGLCSVSNLATSFTGDYLQVPKDKPFISVTRISEERFSVSST